MKTIRDLVVQFLSTSSKQKYSDDTWSIDSNNQELPPLGTKVF